MILVTGCAGFIGFHICRVLLEQGNTIIGIDNLNDYYDKKLKLDRLELLKKNDQFIFHQIDLCDYGSLKDIFANNSIERVCHLAAQAGVRYSISHPFVYQKSNNEGFLNIIELSKQFTVSNFVYASSSSVYGSNTKYPFAESDPVNTPVSLYAATKRSNELVAHTYSHLFNLPCSGLRFFTVYGPWGRPDMALFLFTKAILNGDPIQIFNNGDMIRNFTYIDDIVNGIMLVLDNPKKYELYNIGNNRTEKLMDFILYIEKYLNMKAVKQYLPLQPGDVKSTVADITKISQLGYTPSTNIDMGIKKFLDWYKSYYQPVLTGL